MKTIEFLKLKRKALVAKINSTPDQMTKELRALWKELIIIDEQIKNI